MRLTPLENFEKKRQLTDKIPKNALTSYLRETGLPVRTVVVVWQNVSFIFVFSIRYNDSHLVCISLLIWPDNL